MLLLSVSYSCLHLTTSCSNSELISVAAPDFSFQGFHILCHLLGSLNLASPLLQKSKFQIHKNFFQAFKMLSIPTLFLCPPAASFCYTLMTPFCLSSSQRPGLLFFIHSIKLSDKVSVSRLDWLVGNCYLNMISIKKKKTLEEKNYRFINVY